MKAEVITCSIHPGREIRLSDPRGIRQKLLEFSVSDFDNFRQDPMGGDFGLDGFLIP